MLALRCTVISVHALQAWCAHHNEKRGVNICDIPWVRTQTCTQTMTAKRNRPIQRHEEKQPGYRSRRRMCHPIRRRHCAYCSQTCLLRLHEILCCEDACSHKGGSRLHVPRSKRRKGAPLEAAPRPGALHAARRRRQERLGIVHRERPRRPRALRQRQGSRSLPAPGGAAGGSSQVVVLPWSSTGEWWRTHCRRQMSELGTDGIACLTLSSNQALQGIVSRPLRLVMVLRQCLDEGKPLLVSVRSVGRSKRVCGQRSPSAGLSQLWSWQELVHLLFRSVNARVCDMSCMDIRPMTCKHSLKGRGCSPIGEIPALSGLIHSLACC